jgi:molybdopterin-guanine dinucleotide biosynthesis protein A
VLLDAAPGFGPVGGIERGLSACDSPLLLVLALDLPCMTTAFLQKLRARSDCLTGAVPRLNHDLEPLAAIYPKRCQVLARDFLARARHAAREFAEACLREGAVKTLAVAAADAGCFANWNRPDAHGLAYGSGRPSS